MVRHCLSLVALALPIPDTADESIHEYETADVPPGHRAEVVVVPVIKAVYNTDYGVAKQKQEIQEHQQCS